MFRIWINRLDRKSLPPGAIFLHQKDPKKVPDLFFALFKSAILWYHTGMNIEEIKVKITPILLRHGVKRAAVFGSVARGQATPDSDVDVVIEISRPYGLFEFVEIKHGMEDILGKKVDLVEYSSIKPRIKDSIIKDQVRIL